ncbi:MAG: serpin family protein [Dehalococcoidales bacterium]
MKRFIFLLLSIVLILSNISCAPVTVYGAEAKSDKAYNNSPQISDSVLEALVDGNNRFAFDLYKELNSQKEGNFFYSPFSISLALAMTYAGANGQTKDEMSATLNFLLADKDLHNAFNKLSVELNNRGKVPTGSLSQGFELNIVNATWGQLGFEFLETFLDILAENYDAGIRLLDYENDPEACRQIINKWVSEKTKGKIEDLIPEGTINELTRLVITNAIYFKAAWLHQFDKESTYDGVFHLPDGTVITVPMMHQHNTFDCTVQNNYTAIEMLYDTYNMSMVIIMPKEGKFGEIENSLSPELLDEILGNLMRSQVNLTMPKFEFESDFGLKKSLISMGMPEAFSDNADFSGITDKISLAIGDVVHKAFVSVDEEGTEAAAATAVIIGVTSMPLETTEINIDHSFIFLIRDIDTGSVLFIGRVLNPLQ